MAIEDAAELRALEAVVNAGSISAGARVLGISQQSLSARLRDLERSSGLQLLVRSPSGVSPTHHGELILEWGRSVLIAQDRMRRNLAMLKQAPENDVTIAASQTVAAHLLPRWLVALRSLQGASTSGKTTFTLLTTNSDDVVELVRKGAAGLGFIETPFAPRDLGHTVVGDDRMVAVVAPSHPWALQKHVHLSELADVALVSRERGSGTRDAFVDAVRRDLDREPVVPCLVLSTAAAVRSAVIGGVAPAVLSHLTVADDVALGRLVALDIAPRAIVRPISAVWRGGPSDLFGVRRDLVAVAAEG